MKRSVPLVTEIIRTKDAIAYGRVRTLDYTTGEIIDEDSFTHEINFASDACQFEGDRRALSERIRKRVDTVLLPFPTDFEMITESHAQMEDNFFRHLDRLDLRNYFGQSLAAF